MLIQLYWSQINNKILISNCIVCYPFFSLSTTTCYNYTNNYSLMAYMEYPIILFQQYLLIGIVLYYNNRLNLKVLILSVLYVGIFSAFVCKLLPSSILTILVVCSFLSI